MKKIVTVSLLLSVFYINAQNRGVGINTTTPGTTLDVNGAITNREKTIVASGNTAVIPADISQVKIIGSATNIISIMAPTAPNAGQRLIIYNNTYGGFSADLNGILIPNGKALEFTFSNNKWIATSESTASAWNISGNTVNNTNYLGTKNNTPLFLRANTDGQNPGQALLTSSGSFIVDGTNNSNSSTAKGSVINGINNYLGPQAGSSIVSGWQNDLLESGGANLVTGQGNRILNGAGKSVALGWVNTIRDANQFAIGVGIDLSSSYSAGLGIDLVATEDRSFVFGSGTGWGSKLTNNIPRSIMFGVTSTSTMLIKDQMVGVNTVNPTANFHTVGSVKFENLPQGSGRILVIDDSGNIMISTNYTNKTFTESEKIMNLQNEIDELKKQIGELKSRL